MSKLQEIKDDIRSALFAPKPDYTPAEWCAGEKGCPGVYFNEPEIKGRLSLHGRAYMRDCLNDADDGNFDDYVYVFATGVGKTITFMGHAAYEIEHIQPRCLWVFPAEDGPGGSSAFNNTRFIPMVNATPCLAKYKVKDKSNHVACHGAIYDFTGSNSPAQIAANRCGRVRQDEVEKFFKGSESEASAVYNADRRTDNVEGAKRYKASSPAMESGLIWSEFWNKSNRERRFIPCFHCGKEVIFAWSSQFSYFRLKKCPSAENECYIRWDDSAKKEDGWDLEIVEKTAHFICPHCQGKILDEHKASMDERGTWRPTTKGAPRYRGRHLPAMYSSASSCRTGILAREFLLALKSPEGVKGFINSRLAEPDVSQSIQVDRKEFTQLRIEVGDEWTILAGVDCQRKKPLFWWFTRAFNGKKSHGLNYGNCNTWDELEAAMDENKVRDSNVIIDSGDGVSTADVYLNCAGRCDLLDSPQDGIPVCMGWVPAKAAGGHYWRETDSGLLIPVRKGIVDPYAGTPQAGTCKLELLNFNSEHFEDVFENLRKNKTFMEWTVSESVNTDEYHKHIGGKTKKKVLRDGIWRYKWMSLTTEFPDHLRACEINILVLAYELELITPDVVKTQSEKDRQAAENSKVVA
jgi:hypothetical protein